MGYACPVCETPQRDGEHLANHLAFTAMLGDEAHEEWLDEHAPGWGEVGADELATQVVDKAPDAEFEAVFEDTVDRSEHPHDGHAHGSAAQHDHEDMQSPGHPAVNPDAARSRGRGSLDAEAEDVLREAREMTQELLAEDADGDTSDADDTDDVDADGGSDVDTGDAGDVGDVDADEGKES